jgi:site-specific DNA recombinase
MKIPHVAIYVRVSTTDQVDEGMSLASQPAMVIRKLDEFFGEGRYTYETFTDEGKSGGSGPKPWDTVRKPRDRKGLWDMLQKLKAGEFTHVAAFRLDRIYRDKLGYEGLFSEIMRPKGIQFILVADTFEQSLSGRLTQGILAEIAEFQRLQISENIKQNLDYRRTQGYYLGTIPFGWRRELLDEHLGRRPNIVPVPEEQSIVNRIKELYLGGMSEQAIANQFNEERVPHKRSVGKWHSNTVHLVLINPTHVGLVRQADGSLMKGLHYDHRFYDESVLALIHARLERNRKRLKGVAHTQPFRLFSGIAYCGHCGRKLQGSFHTDSPGYRCLGTAASTSGSHVYISAKTLGSLIVAELAALACSPAVQLQIENQIESLVRGQDEQLSKRAAEVRAARDEIEKKQDALVEAIAGRVVSQSVARKKSDELEKAAIRLEAELYELDNQLNQSASRAEQILSAKRAIHRFGELWDHLSDAEQREALHVVIVRIDVFAEPDRKWLSVKFVFSDEPTIIEVLRGAERYRAGKLDGVASLTPRELAALKHSLDGANYVQIGRFFESTATNAHSLLSRAAKKLGVASVAQAAKLAEPTIRRLQNQLPLFGSSSRVKHSPKRLKVMEYQIIGLSADGLRTNEISLRTGIDEPRVKSMLEDGLAKVGARSAKAATTKLAQDERLLPISMNNRKRIG